MSQIGDLPSYVNEETKKHLKKLKFDKWKNAKIELKIVKS